MGFHASCMAALYTLVVLGTVYGEAASLQSRLNCASKGILPLVIISFLYIFLISVTWNVIYICSLCA